ncbi:MAG: glycosyltransferase family 4 protein [Kiritimatiellae bacterium]|nr:glycosyltransferase family 4 protein [Kiritimatiellia bacterium]
MKIAHVIRRLSFNDWGGAEQVVWNLAKAQQAAGHEVRVFATEALCNVRQETREGLEVKRFPRIYPWLPMPEELKLQLDLKGGNPLVPGLGKELREWGAEVIHCHAMGRISELCIRTGEKTGAKVVVHLHGGAARIPREEEMELRDPTRYLWPWGKAAEILLRLNRRVPEDADGIICVGEDEAEHWSESHPHVLFLPNGVNCGLFEGGREAKREAFPDGFTVVCVARIDRQKDQMALVEALGRHPGMRVRLVGPVTQPDYLEELRARAASVGAEGRLEAVGALPSDSAELAAEYRRADAFVLPSRHEPFGIAVLEAWASGTPVAASTAGGMGRLLARHPEAALSFAPGDAAGLDAALERLETDPEWRKSAAEAGKTAAKRYEWGALAAELLDFYRSLG